MYLNHSCFRMNLDTIGHPSNEQLASSEIKNETYISSIE